MADQWLSPVAEFTTCDQKWNFIIDVYLYTEYICWVIDNFKIIKIVQLSTFHTWPERVVKYATGLSHG